jgi:hypothetical protein
MPMPGTSETKVEMLMVVGLSWVVVWRSWGLGSWELGVEWQ